MNGKTALLCGCAAIVMLVTGADASAVPGAALDISGVTYCVDDDSLYFRDVTGCAVFYSEKENVCTVYNQELAALGTAPNSTFKILSCLMGLECGAIDPANSTIPWGGFAYPIAAWNRDLDYRQAFKTSAIWYYRQVVDRIGRAYVQDTLNSLSYGNCDISLWEGGGNLYFPEIMEMPSVNGFWQESSLKISPVNQVNVLYQIFHNQNGFTAGNIELLKDVMLQDAGINGLSLYGKTGTGVQSDAWTNAWFAGFYEYGGDTVYFAVRENEPGTTGQAAKGIALDIIRDRLEKQQPGAFH